MPARKRFISVLKVRAAYGGTHRGDDMISGRSDASAESLRLLENGGQRASPNELVGYTRMKLHDLLELYAPAWHTKELQKETEAALLALRRWSAAAEGRKTPGKRR
jgi:hypothetical protein